MTYSAGSWLGPLTPSGADTPTEIIRNRLSSGRRESLSSLIAYLRGPIPGLRGKGIGPVPNFPSTINRAEDELIRLGFKVEVDKNARRWVSL